MKHSLSILLAVVLLVPLVGMPASSALASSPIPTFFITSVVRDTTVTIYTYNFPAHHTFAVTMGAMGTRGVGGILVATQDSGAGGSFTATYSVPAALHGSYQIAIRLHSQTNSNYYSYNWFYNNTTSATVTPAPAPTPIPSPGYSGYPTFSIKAVVRDTSVTIVTNNLPPNDSFDVLMNVMYTRGVGGIKVATQASGAGGSQTFIYSVPDALKGQYRIAIRLQSNTGSGYYAYNWFYNNTTP